MAKQSVSVAAAAAAAVTCLADAPGEQSVAALKLETCAAQTSATVEKDGPGFTRNPLGKQQRSPVLGGHCWAHRGSVRAISLAALARTRLTTAVHLLSPYPKVQYKLICQNIQESSLH